MKSIAARIGGEVNEKTDNDSLDLPLQTVQFYSIFQRIRSSLQGSLESLSFPNLILILIVFIYSSSVSFSNLDFDFD